MGKRKNATASTPVNTRSNRQCTPVRCLTEVDCVLSQAEPYVDWDSQSPGAVSRKGASRLLSVLRTVTNQHAGDKKQVDRTSSPLVGLFSDSPEQCSDDRAVSTPVISSSRRKMTTKQRPQDLGSPVGQRHVKRQSPCSSRPVVPARVTRSSTAASDLLLRMQQIIDNPPWKNAPGVPGVREDACEASPEKIACIDPGVPTPAAAGSSAAVVTGDEDLWPDDSLEESDSFVAATQELCQRVEHDARVNTPVNTASAATISAITAAVTVNSSSRQEHVFSKPEQPSPSAPSHHAAKLPYQSTNNNTYKPTDVTHQNTSQTTAITAGKPSPAVPTSKPPVALATSKPSVARATSKPPVGPPVVSKAVSVAMDTSLSDGDLMASLEEPPGQLTSSASSQSKSCSLEASVELTTEELLDFLSATNTAASLPKTGSQRKAGVPGIQLVAGDQPVPPISKPDSTECLDLSPAKCSQKNIDEKKAEALRRRQRLLQARSGSGEGQGLYGTQVIVEPSPVPHLPTATTAAPTNVKVTNVVKSTGLSTAVSLKLNNGAAKVARAPVPLVVSGVTTVTAVPVIGVKKAPGVPVTGVTKVTGVKCSLEEIERKRQEALRKQITRLRKQPLPGLTG